MENRYNNIKNLPEDHIPYRDINDPKIPAASKDVSAAAIVASALVELSTLVKDKTCALGYRTEAEKMLTKLSSTDYKKLDLDS